MVPLDPGGPGDRQDPALLSAYIWAGVQLWCMMTMHAYADLQAGCGAEQPSAHGLRQ